RARAGSATRHPAAPRARRRAGAGMRRSPPPRPRRRSARCRAPWRSSTTPSRLLRAGCGEFHNPRMPPRTPDLPPFDSAIAETFIRASDNLTGLPGYLGAHIVEMTPGRLVARMDVRKDLLTPFGTLHGGVMAGLVDHALGCVLYPLM